PGARGGSRHPWLAARSTMARAQWTAQLDVLTLPLLYKPLQLVRVLKVRRRLGPVLLCSKRRIHVCRRDRLASPPGDLLPDSAPDAVAGPRALCGAPGEAPALGGVREDLPRQALRQALQVFAPRPVRCRRVEFGRARRTSSRSHSSACSISHRADARYRAISCF